MYEVLAPSIITLLWTTNGTILGGRGYGLGQRIKLWSWYAQN